MSDSDEQAPRLDPPGAGVPASQRWIGKNILLPAWCWHLSWEKVPIVLARQATWLVGASRGRTEESLTRRVLVRPLIGLEDSSRHHSYAMVLEHLTIVGNRTIHIVVELSRGHSPPGTVRTEDLKPTGDRSAEEAIHAFRGMVAGFRRRVVEEVRDRRSPARFTHPWFGPLNAYQWLCFAPFHQAVHMSQARQIFCELGPV